MKYFVMVCLTWIQTEGILPVFCLSVWDVVVNTFDYFDSMNYQNLMA